MEESIVELLSRENPVLRAYVFYVILLVFKMLFMSFYTGINRLEKKVSISPEDTTITNGVVKYDDPDIERIRRAHQNDLENIPIFIATAFLYLLTNPDHWIAINFFRFYTLMRYAHTFVYAVYPVRQPTRAIVWTIGMYINVHIGISTIVNF